MKCHMFLVWAHEIRLRAWAPNSRFLTPTAVVASVYRDITRQAATCLFGIIASRARNHQQVNNSVRPHLWTGVCDSVVPASGYTTVPASTERVLFTTYVPPRTTHHILDTMAGGFFLRYEYTWYILRKQYVNNPKPSQIRPKLISSSTVLQPQCPNNGSTQLDDPG